MQDKKQDKYLWGPAILEDRNEIVSRADQKIEYDGTAASLEGLSFGGIVGRRYLGLMEAMERKEIIREDSWGEVQNIKKLLKKRIEVTTMPKSMLDYFMKNMQLQTKLYISTTPISSYTRHLLVTKQLQVEHGFLSKFVESLSNNSEWQDILRKYKFYSRIDASQGDVSIK